MQQFKAFDVVRITELKGADRDYVGSPQVMRPPQIGDIGAIVHVHVSEPGAVGEYTVECVDDAGRTVWVADFAADELRPAPAA